MVSFPGILPSHTSPACAAGRAWRATTHAALRAQGEPGGAPALRPKVLIVEDNLLLAFNTEDFLAAAGFDVVGVAASAAEALVMAARHQPALAVMDIRLPGGVDGIDTAVALLEKHGVRSVFASAHSAPEMKERAALAKPAGWLTKPFALGDLAAALTAALKQSEPKN